MKNKYIDYEKEFFLKNKELLLAKNGKIQYFKISDDLLNLEESRYNLLFSFEKDFFTSIMQYENNVKSFEIILYIYL